MFGHYSVLGDGQYITGLIACIFLHRFVGNVRAPMHCLLRVGSVALSVVEPQELQIVSLMLSPLSQAPCCEVN